MTPIQRCRKTVVKKRAELEILVELEVQDVEDVDEYFLPAYQVVRGVIDGSCQGSTGNNAGSPQPRTGS
jgi:hypothetical protein